MDELDVQLPDPSISIECCCYGLWAFLLYPTVIPTIQLTAPCKLFKFNDMTERERAISHNLSMMWHSTHIVIWQAPGDESPLSKHVRHNQYALSEAVRLLVSIGFRVFACVHLVYLAYKYAGIVCRRRFNCSINTFPDMQQSMSNA